MILCGCEYDCAELFVGADDAGLGGEPFQQEVLVEGVCEEVVVFVNQEYLLLFGERQHVGDFVLSDHQRGRGQRTVEERLELEVALLAVGWNGLEGVRDGAGCYGQGEQLVPGERDLLRLVLETLRFRLLQRRLLACAGGT